MNADTNPFANDSDRKAIWNMLMTEEIEAILKEDFSLIENNYIREGFWGVNAGYSLGVDAWRLQFTSLDDYKKLWKQWASDFSKIELGEDLRTATFRSTFLREIEIENDIALARKKFDGFINLKDGGKMPMKGQAMYHCRKVEGVWKIMSFIDSLPLMSHSDSSSPRPFKKEVPSGVKLHKTAGPYSPVLSVQGQELIVVSGQVPIDAEGGLVGENDIEAQTRQTLENARLRLESFGIGFENVFKVNVYLTDLALWPKFNEIYKEIFPTPLPARTAVESGLLKGFLVEVDMWAMK